MLNWVKLLVVDAALTILLRRRARGMSGLVAKPRLATRRSWMLSSNWDNGEWTYFRDCRTSWRVPSASAGALAVETAMSGCGIAVARSCWGRVEMKRVGDH